MYLLWLLCLIAEMLIKNTECDISEHLDKDNNLYGNSHDTENDDYSYDHNSILKSEEARKFYSMSPSESKKKFSEIIDKMDINHDGSVEMIELKNWITNVYNSILSDDVDGQWKTFGQKNDDKINFDYYVSKTFGSKRTADHLKLINKEQHRWIEADLDNDKLLNKTEFFRFLHPEEFKDLKPLLAQETLDEMDTNKDSVIDINEYLEDMFPQGREAKEEWIRNERQNFGIDRDLNKDGVLDRDEIQNWLLPDSYNRVESEAQHLMELADTNKDRILSKSEMLDKYQVFVGSRESVNYGGPDQSHDDL